MTSVRIETPTVDLLGAVRAQVGESPLWSADEQALWWVDIEGRRLHRHGFEGHPGHRSWTLPQRLACIALHAGGGLLAALEDGVYRLQRPAAPVDGTASSGGPGQQTTPFTAGAADGGECGPERVATVDHPRDGMRFNDGRCDRQGRFWVSSMLRDMALAEPAGALYRLDGGGLSAPLVPGLVTGNGLAFSPAGDVLYLSDSHPSVRRIWAFDVDTADGTLANRREFVDMNQHPGRPDGAAVDADGCYWCCANDAGLLLRFTPRGVLDRTLRLPVSKPSMCAFGGPALDTLFITSIRPAAPADPANGFDATLDGAVLVVHPGVRGIAETPFQP